MVTSNTCEQKPQWFAWIWNEADLAGFQPSFGKLTLA